MHILRFSWNITIQRNAKCQQLLNLDTLDHKNNQAVDFAFLNILHKVHIYFVKLHMLCIFRKILTNSL